MNRDHVIKIAKAWVAHTIKHIDVDHISFDELSNELDIACSKNPDFAWEVVLEVVRMYDESDILDLSDNGNIAQTVLANLAAGPMEDMLVYHGDRIIALVEAEARRDKRIRWLLSQIWRNEISQEVWDRVRRIAIV